MERASEREALSWGWLGVWGRREGKVREDFLGKGGRGKEGTRGRGKGGPGDGDGTGSGRLGMGEGAGAGRPSVGARAGCCGSVGFVARWLLRP